MTWTRIALFMDLAAADFLRAQLVQAGVRAELHAEPLVARLWFVSKRDGGVRLEVPVNESAVAERLLHKWDSCTGLLQMAIRCPECGSLRVDFPQFTEKSIFTNLVMGVISELGLIEREYYCEDCHDTWDKPSPKPRHDRAHMAPNYFLEDAA